MSQSAVRSNSRQKWEYLFAFAAVAGNDGEFRVRFANDQELDNWREGPTRYEYANQQGENGWELLACHPIVFTQSSEQQYPEIYRTSSELRAIEMVFKRPRNGDVKLQG
jgi:hypothetical protein